MVVKSLGGGSSAVAASAHAACARFRGTDPLITGQTRRVLAKALGRPDSSAGIPQARWMRAITFERLIRDERFASRLVTTALGRVGLARPTEVVVANAKVNLATTATLIADAHTRATAGGAATLIHQLAVPFAGFEYANATAVKPDFAVVAAKAPAEGAGTWLIVGDAKDYERVRSRVDDTRLLKGFLQVAVGAESCAAWSQLPADMAVHRYGALAVPRNSFLQPEALVDLLDDHRSEVRMRVAERRDEAGRLSYDPGAGAAAFVDHLDATFDPAACPSCSLFTYCRAELRASADPIDLLTEIGIGRDERAQVRGLVDGTGVLGSAPASVVANVVATRDGVAASTGQLRVDPAGLPGTINVVLAKSDSAALGVYGLATQRVSAAGRGPWQTSVFDDPQAETTRRRVMRALGKEITVAMADRRKATPDAPEPVYLVVPDPATADLLVSIADNLAGIELSRLRWARDREQGREPLTFDGEPATVPAALKPEDRTAVSFLLEEDRARALSLRSPIVDLRAALARHVVCGGPSVAAGRLDYLVSWAGATGPVDHRHVADAIESSEHTPGARLTNRTSDAIHTALVGGKSGRHGADGPADPDRYAGLVSEELAYKAHIVDGALDALDRVADSALRVVHRAIEGDAQAVWRRRLELRASDLVRFGRTYRHWRNSLVPTIESDAKCYSQLTALANPQAAHDMAADAGTRDVTSATVVSVAPLVLDIASRRIGAGTRIVLLHVDDAPCVESPQVTMTAQKGSFKFDGLSIGPLTPHQVDGDVIAQLQWQPAVTPTVQAGDRLVVADFTWFCDNTGNRFLNIARPAPDQVSAPKPSCGPDSYDDDPDAHQYCCRSHEDAEADWSDQLAARRSRGELNPQTWPPVRDTDAFEVSPVGAPTADSTSDPAAVVPDDLTIDDLD